MNTIGSFFSDLLQWFYFLLVAISHWVIDSILEVITNLFWVFWWAFGHLFRWFFTLIHDLMETVFSLLPAYSGDLSFSSDYLRVGLAMVDLVCPLVLISSTITAIIGVLTVALAVRAVLTFVPTIGG